jgi:hypothetical protein
MTTPAGGPPEKGSILGSIAAPVLVVTIVAVIGFVLLEFLKHVVVVFTYCLGGALIVVPLLLASRLVRGYQGQARWHRIATVATVVLVGVGLLLIAHLLSHHGWLLVAIPAALVAISRLVDHVARRRRRPAQPAGGR